MTYIPDATVVTEPVDSQKASTAALEFRTLKTYLAAAMANKQIAGTTQQFTSAIRAPIGAIDLDPGTTGRPFAVRGTTSHLSLDQTSIVDYTVTNAGDATIGAYKSTGSTLSLGVSNTSGSVTYYLRIDNNYFTTTLPSKIQHSGSLVYIGSGSFVTGGGAGDTAIRADAGSLIFSYQGGLAAYISTTNLLTIRTFMKFDATGLIGWMGRGSDLVTGGSTHDLAIRVDGGNLVLSTNGGYGPYVRNSDGVFLSDSGFSSSGLTYGSINVRGYNSGWAGIYASDASKSFLLEASGTRAGAYDHGTATWMFRFDAGSLAIGTVPWTSVTGRPTLLSQFTNDIGAGSGGGVTSFNSRTGAVTLSPSDIGGALGYTPYSTSNPSGYIASINSSMVTTALGYTPYNSSNPSGYISGITSSMVTTALGYTPPQANGTGASGTWGINITGSSASCTGNAATASAATTAGTATTADHITNAAYNGYGSRTVSTSTPSGGSDGDVWYQY